MIDIVAKPPIEVEDTTDKLRLALICDYLEEGWLSMNFCAEMLFDRLNAEHSAEMRSQQIRPVFQKRFGKIPWLNKKKSAFAMDRSVNHFWDYPRHLRKQLKDFDFFHLCDHSYAQLVHTLPPERTGVFCHDIDAFRTILEPTKYPGSARYNAMQSRVLQGFQKAAVVFYTTTEVRKQIEHYNLLDPSRLVQAPLGIAPEYSPHAQELGLGDRQVLAKIDNQPFILSVSSSKNRKRLDILLDVFAAVRAKNPQLKLVRVGSNWTAAHQEQIERLGIADGIIHLQGLERTTLAELYRQALLVLVTSESEGFGLPIIEALACGSIVVASDLPVLREVGESAGVYCPVGDIPKWSETVEQLLTSPTSAPERSVRLTQAAKYSWSSHTQTISQAYVKLSNSLGK
jgi:glycosyltransferase involved in cell wall biosynthesis